MKNLRRNSIVSGILVFSALLFFFTSCNSSGSHANQKPHHHKVLLISFDAFRHDYLNQANTPNFDNLVKEGVQADGLIPIYPSKTFPSYYAIATGLYADHSGIVDNHFYDPARKAWFKVSDRNTVEDGSWYKGEPIWNTAEKNGINTAPLYWVGSEAPIQHMQPSHWKEYDPNMPYTARVDSVLKWMTLPGDNAVDFATLYFEDIDHAGHKYGPNSDSVVATIQRADNIIGYLKQQMQQRQLWDSTDVIVVADHGMAELDSTKVIFLDSIVKPSQFEYVLPDPIAFLQPKPGELDSVYKALKAHEKHYKIYKRQDLPDSLHLGDSPRVADLVMICDLPYSIVSSKYYKEFKAQLPSGNHGFRSSNPKMWGIFIAHGPDFKKGLHVKAFKSVDIYPLIAHLLQIPPAPNDGNFNEVKDFLSTSTAQKQ